MQPHIPTVNDILRKWRSETSHVGKATILLFQRNTYSVYYVVYFNIVTMLTCDVLLRHFGKTMLYTGSICVAYSYLLYTLGITLV